MDKLHTKGFTLVEVLLVMSIMTVIAGTALLVSMNSYRGYLFRSERDGLLVALEKARSQSMNNICIGPSCADGKAHGVYVTRNAYAIFQGNSYVARDAFADENISLQNSLVGNVGAGSIEIVFAQLSGDIPFFQEIGVNDGFGHYSTTSINTEGRISWTNQ